MMPLLRNTFSREERNGFPPGNTCIPSEKDSALSFSWADDVKALCHGREGRKL